MTLREEIDTEYGEWDDAHGGRVIHVEKLPEIIAKVLNAYELQQDIKTTADEIRIDERAKTIKRVLAAVAAEKRVHYANETASRADETNAFNAGIDFALLAIAGVGDE